MSALNERFKQLGFTVGVSYQVYLREISRNTTLYVEGFRIDGYSTYRYSFYKMTYLPGGRKIQEKIYLENVSVTRVLRYVTSFLFFIERTEFDV